jgi:hypothetical protein
VIGGAPAGARMTGRPCSRSTLAGIRPRRATPDTTAPIVLPSSRASCARPR